jgi:putative ATPase
MSNNINHQPLAERMRPKTLEHYYGQQHLVGKGRPLRNAIDNGALYSMIFWGPPGVGKTTLASIISKTLNRPFYQMSAIDAGVKAIREVIDKAKKSQFLGTGGSAVLFIDEIHRFSKSQQDSLLAAVENGTITLIGATTENPSFEVNAALLSRCEVFVLKSFELDDLKSIVHRAIKEDPLFDGRKITIKEWKLLSLAGGGDARKILNVLEQLVIAHPQKSLVIDDKLVETSVEKKRVRYDKTGEQHYDIISAYIKSIRGSDPNAAVYYLARMIEGGEDAKFIARRLVILASEDIGNANPTALVLANSCFQAISNIGMPEGRIPLSQTTIYLATSPKSNASYEAIKKAQALVQQTGDLEVPLALRNAPTSLMKDMGYGDEYQYAHQYETNFIPMEFMPPSISGKLLFKPGNNPRENDMRKRLQGLWKDKYKYD